MSKLGLFHPYRSGVIFPPEISAIFFLPCDFGTTSVVWWMNPRNFFQLTWVPDGDLLVLGFFCSTIKHSLDIQILLEIVE